MPSGALHDDLRSEALAFNCDDESFDLFRAAALVARVETADVDVEAASRQVGALAARVRDRLDPDAPWPRPLTVLLDVLFAEEGFQGDTEVYDAPENSFVHRVLARKRGLPIALAVVTIEVAQRAGIDAYGIAFPGHFLVAVQHTAPDGAHDVVVVDPFHSGQLRSPSGLEAHLSRRAGRPVTIGPEHLAPADPRLVLSRMLNNLRGSYARRRDPVRLSRVLSRLLLLNPGHAGFLLERARARRVLLDDEGARQDAMLAQRCGPGLSLATSNLLAQLEAEAEVMH